MVSAIFFNGNHFADEFILDGVRYQYDGLHAQIRQCHDHQDILGMSTVNGRDAHIESFIYVKRSFLREVAGNGGEYFQDMGDLGGEM